MGVGWVIPCKICQKFANHAHENAFYCKPHFLVAAKGYEECPGCMTTGEMHSNSLPCPSGRQCNLCKGEGVLAPTP